MQRILFLIPSLEYGSAAGQLVQLLEALPGDAFRSRVFVLGRAGPWVDRLKRAGVEIDVAGGRRFDLRPIVALRRVVWEFGPAVLHAWRPAGLRAARVSGFHGRLIASPFLRAGEERSWLSWLDGRLLRGTDRILAFGTACAARCKALGVPEDRLVAVAPGITETSLPPPARVSGIPAGGRVILCVGRLEMARGFHEAIWALDILRYVHPDLHLILAGEGPDRPRLERLAAGLRTTAAVHFVRTDDVLSLLSRADLVWVPGRIETGAQVVLEAMAAGRPVVATCWPRLAELVHEGETGFLVSPGDKTALARQTQRLLTDEPLRRQMGESAQRRAREHFHARDLASRCARVYVG